MEDKKEIPEQTPIKLNEMNEEIVEIYSVEELKEISDRKDSRNFIEREELGEIFENIGKISSMFCATFIPNKIMINHQVFDTLFISDKENNSKAKEEREYEMKLTSKSPIDKNGKEIMEEILKEYKFKEKHIPIVLKEFLSMLIEIRAINIENMGFQGNVEIMTDLNTINYIIANNRTIETQEDLKSIIKEEIKINIDKLENMKELTEDRGVEWKN